MASTSSSKALFSSWINGHTAFSNRVTPTAQLYQRPSMPSVPALGLSAPHRGRDQDGGNDNVGRLPRGLAVRPRVRVVGLVGPIQMERFVGLAGGPEPVQPDPSASLRIGRPWPTGPQMVTEEAAMTRSASVMTFVVAFRPGEVVPVAPRCSCRLSDENLPVSVP
jgi:hypothetical protein